jgi:hypothetical protein
MGETHSRRGHMKNVYDNWSRNQKWRKLFGIIRGKMEGNIKMYIEELWVEGVDRVSLA